MLIRFSNVEFVWTFIKESQLDTISPFIPKFLYAYIYIYYYTLNGSFQM